MNYALPSLVKAMVNNRMLVNRVPEFFSAIKGNNPEIIRITIEFSFNLYYESYCNTFKTHHSLSRATTLLCKVMAGS